MEYTALGRTGFKVSRLGLGGAPIGGDFGDITDEQVTDVVHTALDLGVNFFDTAPLYGRGESERRLGGALKGKRNQVILATKLATEITSDEETHSYEGTIRSVERSLSRLQTDWVDLIQIHGPKESTYEQIMNETVPALLKLKEEGKVRALGMNERDLPFLIKYLKTGVFDTIQFYTRYMLIDHTAKDELLPLVKEHNIGTINGSPLGMGILAENPAPFLQKSEELLNEAGRRIAQLDFLRKPGEHGLVEPAMRFSLSRPEISVTLSGAASSEILRQNVQFCDGVGLSEQDQNKVFALFQDQPLFD